MALFNGTSVRIDNWKILTDPAQPEIWKLFNIVNDPGENNDVSNKYLDIIQKMKAAYDKYSKDVGAIILSGSDFVESVKSLFVP